MAESLGVLSAADQSVNNALSYVLGQCTAFVAALLNWIPAGLGNAADWLSNARAKGFQTSSTPAPGEVVVYGAGGGYSAFGHVGVVAGVNPDGTFQVVEQNYLAPFEVDVRTSTLADVEGFVVPPPGAKITAADPALARIEQAAGLGAGAGSNPVSDLAGTVGGAVGGLTQQVVQAGVDAALSDLSKTVEGGITSAFTGLGQMIQNAAHDVGVFADRQAAAMFIALVVVLGVFVLTESA